MGKQMGWVLVVAVVIGLVGFAHLELRADGLTKQVDQLTHGLADMRSANEAQFNELSAKVRNPIQWVLWYTTDAPNAGYPQAQASYGDKGACLAAGVWDFQDGKGKVVSYDPYMVREKGLTSIYRCLPQGIPVYGTPATNLTNR